MKILMTNGSLMKVKSIAECSSILLTCIKRKRVLKTIFGLYESGSFTKVLLYSLYIKMRKALLQENLILLHANNKGTGQPVHLGSLICEIVILFL